MRRARVLVALMAMLACTDVHAAAKLAGGVQDAGGAPIASAARRLNGSLAQLAVGNSMGPARKARHGFWGVNAVLVLAVDGGAEGAAPPPATLEFGVPTPNPSRGSIRFALTLPAAARVAVGVYDVSGRRVGALEPRDLGAGRWALEWPGRDGDGEALDAGVYFARAVVDGRVVATRRFVRIR